MTDPDLLRHAIARELRRHWRRSGQSYDDISDALGKEWSASAVGMRLRGERNMFIVQLVDVCDVLDADWRQVIGDALAACAATEGRAA